MYIHIYIYTPNVSQVILWWMALSGCQSVPFWLKPSTSSSFSPTHRMEEERGLRPGYPVWADRNPGRSSSKGDEGWRRRAVPNPKDKNPSSRAGSSVGGGSRSSLKKRRYQNPSE